MAEKNYCRGTAKTVKTPYGHLFNFSINIRDLEEHADSDGWVNLTAGKRRETDQYGNTHSVWINDYKKDEEKNDEEIPDF